MNAVLALRRLVGVTQADLAAAGHTSQPTIAAYETGRKSPNLATLGRLAESVGLEMVVGYHPPLVREDRRSLRLHGAIARRLLEHPEAVLAQAGRTLSLMRRQNPAAESLLREWEILLSRPLSDLASMLIDPSPRARELRQVTPFAGVLTAKERTKVYGEFADAEARR